MMSKLIFINQEISLVFEIAPFEAFKKLNNGIFFHLINFEENKSPIQLTAETQKNVISFLKSEFSTSKITNKLINFFERMSEGEYLYIYPYNKEFDELYDDCRESLKLYNTSCCDEHILNNMAEYIEMKDSVQKILEDSPYKINIFEPKKRKKYLGESNKSKRNCIYCGGSVISQTATFKSEAHAIPESIGNKTYIQNEECDICNNVFSETIEEDLCTYLIPERLMFGIRGKEGLPIFQFGDKYVRYVDTESEDFDRHWGKFEITKQLLDLQRPFKGGIILGQDAIDKTKPLNIEYNKSYALQNVYKAMVKCVLGVIDKELMPEFKKTIQWLKGEVDIKKLPLVMIYECAKICREPELYIFTRKSEDTQLPFCYGEFRLGKKRFIFILPFSIKDKRDFVTQEQFELFEKYIFQLSGKANSIVDFSSCDKISVEIPLQFGKEIEVPKEIKKRR